MPKLSRRGLLAALPALAVFPRGAVAQRAEGAESFAWQPTRITAHPLSGFSVSEPERREFGPLTFLSGLELQGDRREFGGISSGVIDPDGKGFIAASDQAYWIAGRFVSDSAERLLGLENVRIAPMMAPDGRRMRSTGYFDTEGMTRIGNRLFVSVERVHQILRFEIGPNGPQGRGTLVPTPDEMRRLGANQGIEALGTLPSGSRHAGSLIAIAEQAPGGQPSERIPGWIINGTQSSTFLVQRSRDFDITDLNFLPGGDMLILERRFSPFSGVAFRLRRIPLERIVPGAVLDGETLIEANMAYHIDNMEVLMIHRASDGRAILTLISDNNFSILQRNIALRFAYRE
jgi:hypothetical protein